MRKSPLSGLSWLQLVAGALAAMTSAWVASYLGVAGTVIGAAVGSLVASIASALYVRGLDHGTTLITESGSVVARSRSGGDQTDVAVADEAEVTVDESPEFSWKRTLLWAGAALATALLVIGGYELATGASYGNADNPSIGRPFSGGAGTDRRDQPEESAPTTEPTEAPQQDAPATPAPTPEPAPSPVPTTPPQTEAPPAPLEEAPSPQPEAVP